MEVCCLRHELETMYSLTYIWMKEVFLMTVTTGTSLQNKACEKEEYSYSHMKQSSVSGVRFQLLLELFTYPSVLVAVDDLHCSRHFRFPPLVNETETSNSYYL